jgi:hypothetical protein
MTTGISLTKPGLSVNGQLLDGQPLGHYPSLAGNFRIARNPAIGSKSFFLDLPFTGGSTAASLLR